jgi:hypothetical protein
MKMRERMADLPSSVVVPFAIDTLGNFCSVAIVFLKKLAKTKFAKIPGSKEFQDLTASTWANTTCRDKQTAIIKTCAYNDRSALKLGFGEEYIINCTRVQFILLPHTMQIFHHRKVKFISMYFLRYFLLEGVLILIVRSILGTRLLYSIERYS